MTLQWARTFLLRSHRTLRGRAPLCLFRILQFTCFFTVLFQSRLLSQQDPMVAHLDSAHTALQSEDQSRASAEYKAFLVDAIHRIANARAAAGDWNNADQNFKECLTFAPDDSVLQLDYASFLFDRDRLAEARSVARSVIDHDPEHARAEILLGRMSFEQKQYSEAARFLESAAGNGKLREVWSLLALTYLRSQQLSLAQSVLEKAFRMLGENANSRVEIATVYYYGDYPDLAIKELRKALTENPRVPDAHYYLGLAYIAKNETAGYADATRELETQLKATPLDFRSHYMLGYIALQQHEMKHAEQELLKAAGIAREDAGTKLLLAQLYSETNRADDAINLLRSLTTTSTSPHEAIFIRIRTHFMLGRLLEQSGHIQEGAMEIETAEELRRKLRAGNAGLYSRTSTVMAEQQANGTFQSNRTNVDMGPNDRARANEFVLRLAPLVGEAYYNLARIAAFNQDQATASRYSASALAWDPSLVSPAGQR
jgi:tetratricopeptide (TPR) repeat protein